MDWVNAKQAFLPHKHFKGMPKRPALRTAIISSEQEGYNAKALRTV